MDWLVGKWKTNALISRDKAGAAHVNIEWPNQSFMVVVVLRLHIDKIVLYFSLHARDVVEGIIL